MSGAECRIVLRGVVIKFIFEEIVLIDKNHVLDTFLYDPSHELNNFLMGGKGLDARISG